MPATLTRSAAAAVGGAAALAAAALACGSDSATATSGASAASRLTDGQRAVATATRAVPGARAYDLERERLRGRRVWEVTLAKAHGRPYEISVSANGRHVVDRRRDDHRSDDAAHVRHARVSFHRALKIAGARGGGHLSEAEIDRERGGRLVWETTFEHAGTETEVDVDARTGDVVRVRHERDDDD
jgi:uncharacterized membrane protein YkoI